MVDGITAIEDMETEEDMKKGLLKIKGFF